MIFDPPMLRELQWNLIVYTVWKFRELASEKWHCRLEIGPYEMVLSRISEVSSWGQQQLER